MISIPTENRTIILKLTKLISIHLFTDVDIKGFTPSMISYVHIFPIKEMYVNSFDLICFNLSKELTS